MPKLPLKHDARTPSQTARLQLTLPFLPPFFLSVFFHGWSASSKSPYRASDSGTRSIILDMTFPLPPSSLFALVPPRNHPPVTPRPVGQYAVEVMWCRLYALPRPLLTARRALTGKMLSSRVSQLFRTYFLPFFRSVCFCLYKVTLIENLISRIVPFPRQANDIFKKFPIFSRFFNQTRQ